MTKYETAASAGMMHFADDSAEEFKAGCARNPIFQRLIFSLNKRGVTPA
jgi:hypothetical protein